MTPTTLNLNLQGLIEIRDVYTGELLLNHHNAIHPGNMSAAVAHALTLPRQLTADSSAYIHRMGFGNGATGVDSAGRVIYKTPRISQSYESSASLYNQTYSKIVSANTDANRIDLVPGPSYTDLKITCTLGFNEPSDQDPFDTSADNSGTYVFDELCLLTYAPDVNDSIMLTHAIFHPVQKSANRSIEIIYTVRIQLN